MDAAKVLRGEMKMDDLAFKIPADGRIWGTKYPRPSAIAKVTGTCDFSKSRVAPGAGNNDLHWVNVATDFHLTKDSTVVLDVPASELACDGFDDFDGTARPLGGGCDYGADELTP